MPPIDQRPARRKRKQRTGAVGRGADTTAPARRPVYGPPAPQAKPRPVYGPPAPRPGPAPRHPSPAFRPIKSQAEPFKPQRERAKRKTRRAEARLPYSPAPYRPSGRQVPAPIPTPDVFRIDKKQTSRSPAFRPISTQTGGGSASPFRVQQSRARQSTRQARNRLPDHPDIPEVDGLYLKSDLQRVENEYKRARLAAANATSDQQVKAIQDSYEKAARKILDKPPEELIGRVRDAYKQASQKLGGTAISELYEFGSLRQRRQMKKVGRLVGEYERSVAEQNAQASGIPVGQDRAAARKPRVEAAGLPLGDVVHQAATFIDERTNLPNTRASLGDIANVPVQLTIATAEDPGGVAKNTARTAVESIAGIPEGVKQLVTDPQGTLGAMAADYEKRYGSIFNNPAEFRRAVKEETGLTPFVLDAASLGVPVGRAATLIARIGPAGRAALALGHVADRHGTLRPLADFAETAHKAARAPRDARRLRVLRSELSRAELDGDIARQTELKAQIKHAQANVRSTERPALRFSGGEGGVRKQPSSPNLIIGLGQRALDKSRRGAYAKRVGESGMSLGPGGRLVIPEEAQISRMTAFRPGEREVTPKTTGVIGRSARELPGLRKYTGRVARDLGGEQSVSRIRLLTHRGRVLNQVDKALNRLDADEQASMKYMLQLGATPDQAGIRILEDRRAQIVAARASRGTQIAPLLRSTNDELMLIDRILDDPSRHLTQRSRAVADELRELQIREARRDPELSGDQELIRRMTPQGAALGVERAPDAEFFRNVLSEIEASHVDRDSGRALAPGLAARTDELAEIRPADRAARARELLKPVKRQRKQAEADVSTARVRLARAEELLRTQERRGRPYENEAVRAARGEVKSAQREIRALNREVARAEGRAGRVTGRLGEREARGGPLTTPEVAEARHAVSVADRRVNRLARQLAREEEKASNLQGRTEGRFAAGRMTERAGRLAADQADVVRELTAELEASRAAARDARARLTRAERDAPRITPGEFKRREASTRVPQALRESLAAAEQRAIDARQTLDQAIADAPRVTPRQAELRTIRERELIASRATREHLRNFEQAMRDVVKASKRKRNMKLEDAVDFADRVRAAADDYGLASPAYWWSSLYPKDMPSLAAAGRGTRAAHANKRYKGTLFDIGAEEHGVDVFTRGIERNIKRRFQQALVARNMETHAYEWSRGHGGAGLTISDLEKVMIDRAIDPKTVEFVDPRVLRKRYSEAPGVERGATVNERDLGGMTEDDFVTTTQQDLAEGRRRWEEIRNDETLRQAQHRFLAVPREVGETLDGLAAGMDNKFWRSMEIVLKQKPARILLGAANVPWLAFQVASNGLLTGLGGGTNPLNVWGAHKWWKGLTPDEKEAVEAELGITHGHHFGMDEPHLGATNNRMVNFWRAYKKTRVGRLGHTINPLNLMFRADEAQNNFFRRVLFYDRSRKAAYRRMGHSWKGIDRAMTRGMDRVLARPPEQQAHLLAQHGADFEDVAKHVNNFLGDYLRFTPSERFLLQRNVMFYGYLRFSLRFTFYTMPIAHPIMANIMGNIGRMGADEIKKLMGVPDDYALPPSMLTQTYFGDREAARKNELRSLPFGRFNPFLNAITQLDGLQQAVGVVSPFYQAIADQAFEESSFTGRDWRIGGRPTPSESDRPRNYFGNAANLLNPLAYDFPGHEGRPRNRIFQQSLLNLAYPYRVATKTGIPGIVKPLETNQSDDALLWRPEPMEYADPEARRGVKKSRRERAEQPLLRKLGGAILPVFPERTAAPAVVERELEREAAIRKRNRRKPGTRKKRRRKKPNRYGGGSRYG